MSKQSSPEKIIIATRESRLALWQANHIRERLLLLNPECQIELLGMTTRGDQILDRPLAKVGGKGLFVKELETALLDGRADIAVHSMKDVPMQLADDFVLASIAERDTPLDAFVSNRYQSLADMPPGTLVGTSSLRREVQLRAQFPYLAIQPLRGNLDTRLRKLDEGVFDAIILAGAGLRRLGLAQRIQQMLPAEQLLPAAGQGALGIECCASNERLIEFLQGLTDAEASAQVTAERTVSRGLGGSCEVPLGAFAETSAGEMRLRAFVASVDATRFVHHELHGASADAAALGAEMVDCLLAQGAGELLVGFPGAGNA